MNTIIGKLKNKSIILAATLIMSVSGVFAADISLSEIEISSANDNGYDIVLKTDKKTEYKKMMKSDNQLVIELKNTNAAENISTIYNEVSTINNITVTPMGKDDLRIQIQGSNVKNSNVVLNYTNMQPAIVSQNFDPNQINLSLPMENYKPVYDEAAMEEEVEESTLGTTLASLNPVTLAQKMQKSSNDASENTGNYKWMTYLGLAIILLTAGKNLFKPAKEMNIGLVHNLKDKEKELAQKLNSSVKETLSLRSKIAQNTTAPSINYGLRAYQNSQKNPYESAPATLRPVTKTKPEVAKRPVTNVSKNISTPVRRVAVPSPVQRDKSAINVDSKKFLESMTKIYEKNGRTDLAMGLKNNMKKVNI